MRNNRPLLTAMMAACAAGAMAFTPVAPTPLDADVSGLVVDLTWEWGNAGKATVSESFEQETFPPAGWSLEKTYSYGEFGSWMQYDFNGEDMSLAHSGDKVAIIQMAVDYDENDPTTLHQDEWLMVKPGAGAVYMDFWYYLYPDLLEDGAFEEFPDHYYVLISRDNGGSWSELWDGRWDMGNVDDVQQASLYLGDPADENTLVAFRAESDQMESLYYLWAIDDVEFFTAEDAATRSLSAKRARNHTLRLPEGVRTHRPFTPADPARKMRRAKSDWLNDGNITFRVYLDGEMVSDYLKARHFTDYSSKEPGTHTYKVLAWSEAEDKEYDAATLDVEIGEVVFPIPRDVKASFKPLENGKYNISVTWEAPEGDQEPDHYNIYVNGKSIGWIDSYEELSVGQSGIYKGAYTFAVEAAYLYPEGTSEKICASVFPGTVPFPLDFKAEGDASSVKLSWSAP